jgi:hypothetical protein
MRGFEVTVAHDGPRFILEMHEHMDAVILVPSAITLSEWVSRHWPDTRILALGDVCGIDAVLPINAPFAEILGELHRITARKRGPSKGSKARQQ